MSIEIIDGVGTTNHVTSDQIGLSQAATITGDTVILNTGEKLGYELVSNNQVNIKDGIFMIQGKRGWIAPGDVEECIIETGNAGQFRNDLICIKYEKETSSRVETFSLEVVRGTPGAAAIDPTVTTGDINGGALLHYEPIYRVKLNGINITAVELLVKDISSIKDLENKADELSAQNSDLAQSLSGVSGDVSSLQQSLADVWKVIYPVGSIYMSTNNANPSTFWGGTWIAWGSGRVPVGVNTSDSNFNAVEKAGGAASVSLAHSHTVASHYHSTGGHTLTVNEIPAHGHSFSGSTDTQGNHMHMYRDYWSCASQEGAAQCVAANSDTDASPGAHTKESGSHVHNFSGTTGNSGGGRAHNHGNTGVASPGTNSKLGATSVLQPYITCYMWKRTA